MDLHGKRTRFVNEYLQLKEEIEVLSSQLTAKRERIAELRGVIGTLNDLLLEVGQSVEDRQSAPPGWFSSLTGPFNRAARRAAERVKAVPASNGPVEVKTP